MHGQIRLILATAVCLAYGIPLAPVYSAAADLYVSPHGADAWSGTRPDPTADKTDGPFATLDRARDAARRLNLRGANARPVTDRAVRPKPRRFRRGGPAGHLRRLPE